QLEDGRDDINHMLDVGLDMQEITTFFPSLDLNTTFMYLPEEVIRPLQDISAGIGKLVQQKEEAITEQDFDKAARLRDKAEKIKQRLLDAVKQLQALIRESQDDSK